jgi:hypothetical protein
MIIVYILIPIRNIYLEIPQTVKLAINRKVEVQLKQTISLLISEGRQ